MRTRTILLALALIAPMSILLHSCSSAPSEPTAEEVSEEVTSEAIKVMRLEYKTVSRGITQTAHLQPNREVHLAPAQPGRIDKIYAEAGSKVNQGQVLVEMDKTQLQQAQLQLQSLETEYNRLKTLRETGSVSQQQYDQIETQYNLAKSNVEFLKDNTRLYSPFSGTISGKYFENGEMYSGAPNTQAGKAAILSIVQTNRLKVLVNVPERFFPSVKPGMSVEITTDVYPGKSFTGKVEVVMPTVDRLTRTIPVEVSLPNPDEKLKPGMFARARFNLMEEKVFVVPSLAVLKLQGSNERYVFLEEDGKAKRVVVEMGDRFDDMIEVISDEIKPGVRLVVAGQARLLNGTPVSVVD